MWSISPARLLGSLSAQRITLFVLVMIVALFSASIVTTSPAQAQTADNNPDGMAVWSGENLDYGGIGLTKSSNPQNDDNLPNLQGTACQDNPNIFYSPVGTRTNDTDHYWMYVICLSSGIDGSDKSKPIPAMLLEYRIPKSQYNLGTDKPSKIGEKRPKEIKIAAEGTDALGRPINTSAGAEPKTTCDSTNTQGIGWIICPVTNWLARGMDALYDILKSFLIVSPVAENKSLFYMWGLIRNFANILFIVAFLIIIYSQITSVGISNHGVKRMLPRLIIAAVLVNISFWVTAAAVDLSNILGVSLQDTFVEIRNKLPAPENINLQPEDLSWQSIAGATLSGGMGGIAIGGALFGVAVSAGASIYLLLPAIVGVIVSALVAILVLAARQALITILIILSPLAFAAYILPSTEKYFERWRSLLTTMLILFPAFAVIFGGAQLAGMAIINSALENDDNPNFFNVIILGMIVQVAPLVITPLLIKLGGSLIGRIAGIVNDPNKGIIDKSRKFAQERHDMHKYKQISEQRKDGKGYAHNNPLAQAARWKAIRDTHKDRSLKTYQGGVEAAYEQDHRAHDIYKQTAINEMLKSEGHDVAKAEVARDIANREALRRLYIQQQISKSDAEFAEARNKTTADEMKTKPSASPASMRDLADRMHDVSVKSQDEAQRQSAITQEYDIQYWKGLADDAARQAHAGAAGIAEQGEARVANIARQKQIEEREKLVGAGLATINQLELTNDDRMNIIFGHQPTSPRAASLRPDFHEDLENQSASIRSAFEHMPQFMRHKLIEDLDMTMSANGDVAAETKRSEAVGQLKKSRPIWISTTILNKMEEGTLETDYRGRDGTERMIKEEVIDKRGASAKTLTSADRDDLKRVTRWIRQNQDYFNSNATAKRFLQEELIKAYNLDEYSGALDKRVNELDDMWLAAGLDSNKNRYGIRDGKIVGL